MYSYFLVNILINDEKKIEFHHQFYCRNNSVMKIMNVINLYSKQRLNYFINSILFNLHQMFSIKINYNVK